MNVIAYDPFINNADLSVKIADKELSINIVTQPLDKLLKESDYISLHVPMPKDGKAVLGEIEFNKMKDGVRIVNAARGGVINEDDLISAIDSNKVAAAALDVFVGEPKPRKDLLSHEKIALTPHIGAATNEAQDRIGTELADKIIEFFNN